MRASAAKFVWIPLVVLALSLTLSLPCAFCESPASHPATDTADTALSEPEFRTFRRNGAFVSEGWMDVDQDPSVVASVLGNFDEYWLWALRGLDGRDPVSRIFYGIITDIHTVEMGMVRVTYDVALPWPFGSTGNTAFFLVRPGEATGEILLVSTEKTVAYESALIRFWPAPAAAPCSGSRVHFSLEMKFVWFVNRFLPADYFHEGIAFRLEILVRNLAAWLSSGGQLQER